MKIFLLGLPGSGKTTLGKALAATLRMPFIDLDEAIAKVEGKSIQEIFKLHKEDYFRKLESRHLSTLCLSEDDFVMATGGGTPCFADNITVINQTGTSIFLDVAPRIISQRIQKSDIQTRPLFAQVRPDNLKDSIEFMRSQRMPYYRQAHLSVGPETSTDEIITLLKMGNQR